MFKNVLVAYDGSDGPDGAVVLGQPVASLSGQLALTTLQAQIAEMASSPNCRSG